MNSYALFFAVDEMIRSGIHWKDAAPIVKDYIIAEQADRLTSCVAWSSLLMIVSIGTVLNGYRMGRNAVTDSDRECTGAFVVCGIIVSAILLLATLTYGNMYMKSKISPMEFVQQDFQRFINRNHATINQKRAEENNFVLERTIQEQGDTE